jgi:hypothetical protein
MIPQKQSGNNGEKVTPVPIPNTEVKLLSADGSWDESPCESRTLPGMLEDNLIGLSFLVSQGHNQFLILVITNGGFALNIMYFYITKIKYYK